MKAVRSFDTTPELLLRKALHRRGCRYRLHVRSLPGTPDIVFAKYRVAIFVDGDFWHGRKWILRGLPSLESQFHFNARYCFNKIRSNIARDARADALLRQLGWEPIRVYESDILRSAQTVADRIAERIASRRMD
jgi:DNA mismatch endonuclease (patch repair protein)